MMISDSDLLLNPDDLSSFFSHTLRLFFSAYFLWKLENPKPISERRFFKRYFTFWHLYNIIANAFFLIGLIMKVLELAYGVESDGEEKGTYVL